jgi:hypothetical protein
MRLAFKPILTLCLALSTLMCLSFNAAADEESYQLEQMRKLSKTDKSTPDQELMQTEESALLAETDLKALAKPDADFSRVEKIEPTFEKPKLDLIKPQL